MVTARELRPGAFSVATNVPTVLPGMKWRPRLYSRRRRTQQVLLSPARCRWPQWRSIPPIRPNGIHGTWSFDLPLAHRAVQVAKNHRLRGSDAVYVSVAETFNSKLIAWDAEMLVRGADVVTTMTPLEWMKEEAATG